MSSAEPFIEIDQVVLRGLYLSQGRLDRIRQETVRQLERLIEQHGLPPGAGPVIDIGALRLPHHAIRPGSPDREIARQLALAVYRRLHPIHAKGADPVERRSSALAPVTEGRPDLL